jgi:hypothetical protein
MSVLTITAVDNATDEITIVGHGQVTGDGPAAIRNTLGGDLPTGLALVTDYWIIRVDDDTIKLASSSANALANTPINLTTDGDAGLVLEIGLPYRRAVTHVANVSQIKASTMDAIQDSLKALHALLTGQEQSIWTGDTIGAHKKVIFPRPNIVTAWAAAGDISATPLPYIESSAPTATADICLSDYMNQGQTLNAVRIWAMGDDAVDLTATVYHHDSDAGTSTPAGTITENNLSSASMEFIDVPGVSVKLDSELDRIWLRLVASTANAKVFIVILGFA